jgi:hypothetical protein
MSALRWAVSYAVTLLVGKFKADVRISIPAIAARLPQTFQSSWEAARALGQCPGPSASRWKTPIKRSTAASKKQSRRRESQNRRERAADFRMHGQPDFMDGDNNGAFTGMLQQVWNGGKFNGNHRKLRDKIVSQMPSTQTPNYYCIGTVSKTFEAQKLFSI